jgi:hypothetical protein
LAQGGIRAGAMAPHARTAPAGQGRSNPRIVRERVTADGVHQYCVAWRHPDNTHSGFTWEDSLALYDSGHGRAVRQFESSAALSRRSAGRRSPRLRAGLHTPLASPVAPVQPARPATVDPLMPDAVKHSHVRLGELQRTPQAHPQKPTVGDSVRLTPGLTEPACGWPASGRLSSTSTGRVTAVLHATRECVVEFQAEASTLHLAWSEIQLDLGSLASSSTVPYESMESRNASLHISQQGRPSSAAAVLAPLSSKQPSERKSQSTRSKRMKQLAMLSELDRTAPKSASKSLFDAPPFDPKSLSPPKIGVGGYVPAQQALTRVRGQSVHRVVSTSDDDLRRAMMKAQVRQFIMVKRGCDEARMAHLTFKHPGIPGSYDRYTFMLHTAAVRIQAWLRGFMARAQFRLWIAAAIHIQRFVRGHIGRLRFDDELLFQRRIRWQFRKLASLVWCKEIAAWRGRLLRLTQDCLRTRDQRNRLQSISAFAENRDQEIRARIEAYRIVREWAEEQRRLAVCSAALDEYLDATVSAADPTEMLRASLVEQGRAESDIATLVAQSEALRLQLTVSQDSKIACTQREISELMFHLHAFDSQFELHTPRSPPDSHFAPDAMATKRERSFVEFRLHSSKRPKDASFPGAHYVTIEMLRTCNILDQPAFPTVCKLRHGDQQHDIEPSDDGPCRRGIRQWGGKHTFKIEGSVDAPKQIACTFARRDDSLVKLGEFKLKIGDLVASNEPVCRYTWLTLRRPKPTVHVKVNVNKKESEYGSSGHWEGMLTVQIVRATGLDIVDSQSGHHDAVRPPCRLLCCETSIALLTHESLHADASSCARVDWSSVPQNKNR